MIRNNRGFSLLEVLVGVSIIGIISAIAVPTYTDYRESASVTASDTSLKNIRKAYNLCISTSGAISSCASLEDLNVDCDSCTVNTDSGDTKFCGAVATSVGGSTFQACWDTTDEKVVYAGDFKICYGQKKVGAANAAEAVFPNILKCKKTADCTSKIPATVGTTVWSGGTCKAGGASKGICTAGECID